MKNRRFASLNVELLESRDCPAPLSAFLHGTGNLRIMGTPDFGLEVIALAPGEIRVTDGVFDETFTGVTGDVQIYTEGEDDFINIDLTASPLPRGLHVDTGDGDDVVFISGSGGLDIPNHVTIKDATFTNIIDLGVTGNVRVTNAFADFATLLQVTLSDIGGNLEFYGGESSDTFGLSASTVGGKVAAWMRGGFNNGMTVSGSQMGSYEYRSSGFSDSTIQIDGDTVINTSATFNMGNGFNFLDLSGTVGSTLRIVGGNGGNFILIGLFETANLGGGVSITLGHGDNFLDLGNVNLTGTSFSYTGGDGTDTVFMSENVVATNVRFTFKLGGGDDLFILDTPLDNFRTLYIDFGAGDDTFTGTSDYFTVVPPSKKVTLVNL